MFLRATFSQLAVAFAPHVVCFRACYRQPTRGCIFSAGLLLFVNLSFCSKYEFWNFSAFSQIHFFSILRIFHFSIVHFGIIRISHFANFRSQVCLPDESTQRRSATSQGHQSARATAAVWDSLGSTSAVADNCGRLTNWSSGACRAG